MIEIIQTIVLVIALTSSLYIITHVIKEIILVIQGRCYKSLSIPVYILTAISWGILYYLTIKY